MNIKTKKIILYSLYGTICLTFIISLLFVNKFINPNVAESNLTKTIKPVDKVDQNIIPVFEDNETFKKPFLEDDIQVKLNFYNVSDGNETQENSIIYYQNTYMPSTGVFYAKDLKFDITSIYSGKVIEISESDLLGNIIKIDYGNNIIGLYQCVDDIKVKVGDSVITGSILATSSTCNIFEEKGNGFYLELIYNGKNLNPELYYGKRIEEF